ncbi:tRNA U34 5-methylaminomethyl-2-thiouridine-forming methyltransferase MnmC [Fodinibius roseus]|uniref:tRNA U34 5-methylaminomethyl-2-thiouridine-forming methyltransferase MnmC n=1 Tax=Fodinibius roseus TaxID=1194090 RepID=A0A1M5HT99_9BACT|nr:tRNA (5-methylaminomethyl-2-thiouridine)(34)-methyltransferase MnmD [Fodinibius roseus]SHG19167.1 tRNA U34 5-methylaminomethyl-2-thiouridine-forming methyltransferase MnmC [Fodinibius roseus]
MSDDSIPGNRLVETRDGSHTVYSPQFDQHYHNPNGAVAESRYVFFEQNGLAAELGKADSLTILEVGFGTGLNLMLLLDEYLTQHATAEIDYYSVEAFPLDPETAADFNFGKHLDRPESLHLVTDLFQNLSRGMNHVDLLDTLRVHLFCGLFDNFNPDHVHADYIFHDAFSPDVNGELWTGDVFKKIKRFSADNVILSTYCAASKARGAMAWAGWKVARCRGALGKREMSLAALEPDRLGELERINEERLARRYEKEDF